MPKGNPGGYMKAHIAARAKGAAKKFRSLGPKGKARAIASGRSIMREALGNPKANEMVDRLASRAGKHGPKILEARDRLMRQQRRRKATIAAG